MPSEEILKLAVIGIGFCLLVLIPMVAILTEHQRKMAELLRKPADPLTAPSATLEDEIRQLRLDVDDLKTMVASLSRDVPASDRIEARLGQDA